MHRSSRAPWKVRPKLQPTAILCPHCHKMISATAATCIHCGWMRPKAYTTLPLLGELISQSLRFTPLIAIFTVGLYLLSILLDLPVAMQYGEPFSLLAPGPQALYRLGMGGLHPLFEGRWWTLVTANYLHVSLLHIAFNLLWLRQLGPLVEDLFGSSRFAMIYTCAGVAGSVVSVLAGTGFFVGASGAVFGLFGALLYYGRARGGVFGTNLFRNMLFWCAIGLLLGAMGAGVDNWGHLGGAAGGIVTAWMLGYQERRKQGLVHHLAAFGTCAIVGVCFLAMVVNFFIP